MVIAVDSNYLPMLEVTRRHAMTALATGRAQVLDLGTWAKLGLGDVVGRSFYVIVFPKTKAISDFRLGFGRGNAGILHRDDHVCQYEGCHNRATTVDHVTPKCQGGKTSWDNLVGCCRSCNQRKGGRTPAEAGMKLKASVRSPRFHLLERFQTLVKGAA
jgi:hypothetical protein